MIKMYLPAEGTSFIHPEENEKNVGNDNVCKFQKS